MYLCDDDLLYPNAFATFVDAFRDNPIAMAMYASQDIGWLGREGLVVRVTPRRDGRGKRCSGRIMDCQVDYLQLCHRLAALWLFPIRNTGPRIRRQATTPTVFSWKSWEVTGQFSPLTSPSVKTAGLRGA